MNTVIVIFMIFYFNGVYVNICNYSMRYWCDFHVKYTDLLQTIHARVWSEFYRQSICLLASC